MTRKQVVTGIAIAAALAVVAVFFIFNSLLPMTSVPSTQPTTPTGGNAGLVVQDEQVGTGAVAQPGDTIIVQYTGKFQDGTVFDTSVGKGPLSIVPCPAGTTTGLCFTLGAGQVIPGWDAGLQGMKVGGKRLLIVPPTLGYGSQDYGPIPGNSTLIFEVDLLGVTSTASSTKTAPEGPSAD